ncbi:MAG: PilW family protein [Rhodanobacter sp.]
MLPVHSARQAGVTLIELIIAMVLGLLVAGGIITIFISTSSSSRVQTQLASLQEGGRFAITRMKGDLQMANGQYCSNTGGVAKPAAAQVFLDGLRAPKVYVKGNTGLTNAMADVTTIMGASGYTPAPTTAPYTFPSFLSMRGYECAKTGTCLPTAPAAAVVPGPGKTVGKRVNGADILTVRYVSSSRGWAVGGSATIATTGSTAAITSITLATLASTGEPPANDFASGHLAMLADCSGAQIFPVTVAGSSSTSAVLTPVLAPTSLGTPTAQPPQSAPKLFDFNRDYQTVTYYLRVVDAGNGQTTGALIRRVNGGTAGPGGSEDELVRGVERMDFRYGVQDADGNVRFLTADKVDAATGITCPPAEPSALTTKGCLWRAITSIEVHLLMDGQVPLPTLTTDELKYSYSQDNSGALAAPTAHAIQPFADQGFTTAMLRREFIAVVAVRNYNP